VGSIVAPGAITFNWFNSLNVLCTCGQPVYEYYDVRILRDGVLWLNSVSGTTSTTLSLQVPGNYTWGVRGKLAGPNFVPSNGYVVNNTFKVGGSFDATVTGPTSVPSYDGDRTYQVSGSYTSYEWWIREDGGYGPVPISGSNSPSFTVYGGINSFYIWAKVTNSAGQVGYTNALRVTVN